MLIYFKMYFFPVMHSWIFSIISPVFRVTWSFRNFEYAVLVLKKQFLISSMLFTVLF